MTGKEKCRMLRQIRRRIAEENDIPLVTGDCRYQGECRGTCPKCESELRELERELALRASRGRRAAVAALCAGLVFSASGCLAAGPGTENVSGRPAAVGEPGIETGPEIVVLSGEVAWPGETANGRTGSAAAPRGDKPEPETGEIVRPEEPADERREPVDGPGYELMGMVPWN